MKISKKNKEIMRFINFLSFNSILIQTLSHHYKKRILFLLLAIEILKLS